MNKYDIKYINKNQIYARGKIKGPKKRINIALNAVVGATNSKTWCSKCRIPISFL